MGRKCIFATAVSLVTALFVMLITNLPRAFAQAVRNYGVSSAAATRDMAAGNVIHGFALNVQRSENAQVVVILSVV